MCVKIFRYLDKFIIILIKEGGGKAVKAVKAVEAVEVVKFGSPFQGGQPAGRQGVFFKAQRRKAVEAIKALCAVDEMRILKGWFPP